MTIREQRIAAQDRRRDELAEIRIQRPLTEAETAEEARLERLLHARVWRAAQIEEQRRLDAAIAARTEQPKIEEFA